MEGVLPDGATVTATAPNGITRVLQLRVDNTLSLSSATTASITIKTPDHPPYHLQLPRRSEQTRQSALERSTEARTYLTRFGTSMGSAASRPPCARAPLSALPITNFGHSAEALR